MKIARLLLNVAMFTSALCLGSADAGQKRPVVVELFTSQGCSSCPPANANLIKLGDRPDVLTLSFAVTYWDYLGWKDSFGKNEFTRRQAIYEPALGERGPFTPQMVVDGKASNVGFNLNEVEDLIADVKTDGGPMIDVAGHEVKIGKGAAPADGADVWLVRYDPKLVIVPVGRGENRGASLPHSHVVHSLDLLGSWVGDAASFSVKAPAGGLRTAILVQRRSGGPMISAFTD